jgi:hypothetical protein
MSEYARKFDAAMAELAKTDMWPSNYAPPLLKMQRRFGWLVRPPHYASVWRIIIGYGLWFGPTFGVAMWVLQWRAQGFSVLLTIALAAFSGALFGAFMSAYYVYIRRKHQLSSWEDL